MGLQWVTGSDRGYKDLQGVTRVLQKVKRGYKGLQGVSSGYRGLQGVTGGY